MNMLYARLKSPATVASNPGFQAGFSPLSEVPIPLISNPPRMLLISPESWEIWPGITSVNFFLKTLSNPKKLSPPLHNTGMIA